jgi:nucleotide-binding universal stress UspA family protein
MKGGSPIREAFLGSTATNLLEKAPCPVLAVPEDITLKNIDTIIYATALDLADISAIQEIVEWAKLFNASINIVHISTKNEYAGEDQMEWFKDMLKQNVDYGKMHFELSFSENVYEALQQYIEKINPDIIAMLEREGYSLIKSIWHRDLVKRMKTDSKIPLLSYHKKNLNLELSFS